MRFLTLAIVAAATLQFAAPARAQTYDPRYPYCLQIYDDMVHYTFECGYTSMPQCQASASGRNASCVANPYYGRPRGKAGPQRRPPAQ
jgi:hypothetical protein